MRTYARTLTPSREDAPPHLNFAPMDNAADALALTAQRYQTARDKFWGMGLPTAPLQDLNQKLLESEPRLTAQEGLLRRAWYKHMICTPGVYAGYEAKTIPGVREAIDQKHRDEADAEIERVAKALDGERALIDSLVEELEPVKRRCVGVGHRPCGPLRPGLVTVPVGVGLTTWESRHRVRTVQESTVLVPVEFSFERNADSPICSRDW
jgi:hypothetical protein